MFGYFSANYYQLKFILIHFAECDCDPNGTNEGRNCDPNTGQCPCKEGFGGQKCDECKIGFFGYPNCQGISILRKS